MKRCFIFFGIAAFFLAMVTVVVSARVQHRTVTEKLTRTIRSERILGNHWVLISPDGDHTAWVERKNGGVTVYLDGKAIGTHSNVRDPWCDYRFAAILPGLVFSKTGGQLAYVTIEGKQSRVVVNGKPGKLYDEVGMPIFSSNGERIAYAARKGAKWFSVIDGREDKRIDGISISCLGSPIVFNPSGNIVAYVASAGNKEMTVINGRKMPPCFSTTGIVFSRDGAHYAYTSAEKSRRIIKDGKPILGACPPFVLSPNGKRIAYCVIKPSIAVTIGESIDCNGKRTRYVAKGNAYHFKLDGKLGNMCKYAPREASFSPNSKRFAYAEMPPEHNRNNKKYLTLDGIRSKQMYGRISSITFSPDSKRLACCVTLNTKRRLLVDGQVINISGWASNPVFSPDSKHLGFMIGNSIALDKKKIGKSGYSYRKPLMFSPDSRHVLCIAQCNGRESVSIDGVPRRFYDDILQDGIFIDAPNRFHYFAKYGKRIYRVEEYL